MRLSLDWLSDYIDVGAPDALAESLTMSGIEVEAAETTPDGDTVFEVEVTPNRPDCLSHWGVARDLAALTGKDAEFPKIELQKADGATSAPSNLVEIENGELCPRYTARIIRNVKVADSPEWLRKRLEAVGLRPINNVVDITNYVLMELGHPLHAFDLDLLAEQRIVVRNAAPGETLATLDDVERKLTPDNLVICDAEKPVALAGVMGGRDTAVSENTANILLESAVFAPSNIRATSRDLKISTDSSFRFERGADFEMAPTASDRAAALILELAGGELASELVDEAIAPPKQSAVKCRLDRIRKLLGAEIADERIIGIFQALFLSPEKLEDSVVTVTSPSYRLDLKNEADLAEEVARIHGLDSIPAAPLKAVSGGAVEDDARINFEKATGELRALGLDECTTYSLVSLERALLDAKYGEKDVIILENPLSLDLAALRASLLPQMLETVERNISRGNRDLRLFEAGRVFNACETREERLECVLAMTGRKHPERFSGEKSELLDYFDLKGVLESWFEHRHLTVDFAPIAKDNPASANYAEGMAAEISLDGNIIGDCGIAADRLTKGMRIQTPLLLATIELDAVLSQPEPERRFTPVPQYPSTTRDVAFLADASLSHAEIMEVILSANIENLESAEIFDLFEDPKTFGADKKSLAYSLVFRNPNRTLNDEEVNTAHERLRQLLADKLGVTLR